MPDIESLEPKVNFIRGTESQIGNLTITDGQFIVSEEGNIYVDIDNERVPIKENDIIAVYEKSPTTASHSVNDYIYYNNKLYRVILAIAVGDIITIGTNVELANDIEAGTPIYITGLPDSSSGIDADNVNYDNSTSGLTADNVQDAIDELKSDIDNIPTAPTGGSSKYNTNCKAKIGLSIDKDTAMYGYAVPKTWNGYDDFAGDYIWTDGENIYYSYYSDQYVLDKATETWGDKVWYDEYEDEIENLHGECVWSDGDNIYYSRSDVQYVLNKSTGIWEDKVWSGLDNFNGSYIWTDGINIFYSNGSTQYVLNKSTSTWGSKSWSGLTDFVGYRVWTNGEFIYYSDGTSHYRLYGKSTSAWSSTSWTGLTDFDGTSIWTDGYGIYYSSFGDQYTLKKADASNVWSGVTWTGIGDFNAESIWSDGEHIYYSDGTNHYELHTFVPSTKF